MTCSTHPLPGRSPCAAALCAWSVTPRESSSRSAPPRSWSRHLGVETSWRDLTVLALTSIVTGVTDIGLTTIGLRELAVRDESGSAS